MTSSGGNCSIKTHPGRFCLHFGELRENRKRFALYLRRNSQIKYNLEENVSLKLCVSVENCFHKNIYLDEQRPEEESCDRREGFVFNDRVMVQTLQTAGLN